jgi:hypothetical protein
MLPAEYLDGYQARIESIERSKAEFDAWMRETREVVADALDQLKDLKNQ